MANPVVIFCPYLSIQEAGRVGEWIITPFQSHSGAWADEEFRQLALTLVRAHTIGSAEGVIIANAENCCDGLSPSPAQEMALQRAVTFMLLDANPTWTPEARSGSVAALRTATSDNADLHLWPIDIGSRSIAVEVGHVVSTISGPFTIDDHLRIDPPLELHRMRHPVALDFELGDALYRTVTEHGSEGVRVAQAVAWLDRAWRNTPSITWEDRVVMLKTGFEALTGESATWAASDALEQLFNATVDRSAMHLLWDPTEKVTMEFDGHQCTPFGHWFRSFGAARNAVIHGDEDPTLSYAEPGRYEGPYFHTAERMLREAIKIRLAALGHQWMYAPRYLRAAYRNAPALLEIGEPDD